MLTEHLGTGIAEALLRLRAYAYAHDRRMADVAADIVARRLRLSADLLLPEMMRHEALAGGRVRAVSRVPVTGSCCCC